ncbi:MAG TPA: alpha-amylase family glycosyl hydrolase [Blastocatellia bacterium]|nr:alpha-amylase family glycosyl hydrolase [Blastocatellia bacterium]
MRKKAQCVINRGVIARTDGSEWDARSSVLGSTAQRARLFIRDRRYASFFPPVPWRRLIRVAELLGFLLAVTSLALAQAKPEVLKVEPPNWWARHSINPVRVMIRGRNLAGARVEALGYGIQTGLVRINAAGTYIFVDLVIRTDATPGRRVLRVTTPAGTAEAPFEISTPLPREGRFQGFTTDDVIYLIMPDRFSDGDATNNDPSQSRGLYDRSKTRYYHGGDFQGVINHLPYLKSLGVTAIWLTPWYDNVNHLNEFEQYPDASGGPKQPITDYHGYGAVDFYGVEEHFGTLAKLRDLVDAAHHLGIKVIQDQVANHTGPYHPWADDSPTPTWYNGTKGSHLANTFQTWVLHDPHPVAQMKRETLEGWFIDILPDLNQNDEETARYIIQNTLWWIGVTGIDAIRQDTWQYVPNGFWRGWTSAIKREYPNVNVVGEVLDGDVAHCSFYQGGRVRFDGIDTGLDTLFDFPLLFSLRRAFAEGKSVKDIARVLSQDQLYPNPNVLVSVLGNHDLGRFMNEPGATVTGLNLAHTLLMTTRGTPQLYYGDEIAMKGGGDPDNRLDFPGGFPGDTHNAFDAQGRTADEQLVFGHLQRLGRLRAELEPLRRGALVNLYVADQQYAYARRTERASVIVVFNNDNRPATIEFDVSAVGLADGGTVTDRLGSASDALVESGKLKVNLPARAATIFVRR